MSFEKNNKDNIMSNPVIVQNRREVIITFLLLLLGLETKRNTAEGIENCANVVHNDKVGIINIYNDIVSLSRSRDNSIRFASENILVISVLDVRIINEFINFLFIKYFLYSGFSFIIVML